MLLLAGSVALKSQDYLGDEPCTIYCTNSGIDRTPTLSTDCREKRGGFGDASPGLIANLTYRRALHERSVAAAWASMCNCVSVTDLLAPSAPGYRRAAL